MAIPFAESFASHEKAQYWDYDKNELTPDKLRKCSEKKGWFNCNKCPHSFEKILYSIIDGSWCPYCANKKLCDQECQICYDKSFASHPKAQCWNYEKNELTPRQVFKTSNIKYWFKCGKCPHSFEAIPGKIVFFNRWCPYCANQKLCDQKCLICFNKSFASHPKSQYWDYEKNELTPRQVFKSSDKKYWFNCNKCLHCFEASLLHVTQNNWCSYCGNQKLCDQDCQTCFDRSFASHPKAKYWNYEKNDLTPRQCFKSSSKKNWFNCDKCLHSFDKALTQISSGYWCPYCSKQKLCGNNDCLLCYEKSFASHVNAKFWDYKKNKLMPRQLFKTSGKKCWFICKNSHNFESTLYNVSNGKFCGLCHYKTQKKLYEWLIEIYPETISQPAYDWCRNINYLPFDFALESIKLIIELDGEQHFNQVSNWKSPDETRKIDIYKAQCALLHEYSIIRIDRLFIINNQDWQYILQNAIHGYDTPQIIYISDNPNLYDKHKADFAKV